MNENEKSSSVFFRRNAMLAVLVIIVLGAIFLLTLGGLWGSVKQPIAFNHKIHGENGLACLDCHIYYETQRSSGKPPLEICAGCHEEPQGEGKAEAMVVSAVQAGEEIAWKRLYRIPEDVIFSHSIHVATGELECSLCHGSIGTSEEPPKKPVKLTMKKCMKCHEAMEADNDCIACHR